MFAAWDGQAAPTRLELTRTGMLCYGRHLVARSFCLVLALLFLYGEQANLAWGEPASVLTSERPASPVKLATAKSHQGEMRPRDRAELFVAPGLTGAPEPVLATRLQIVADHGAHARPAAAGALRPASALRPSQRAPPLAPPVTWRGTIRIGSV